MPRTRQRTFTGSDGGALERQNRPPAEHLPRTMVDLFDELDRLSDELADDRRNVSRWKTTLETDERDAIQADALAVGTAAREGRKVANPTAHLDAVRGRLREANDAIPALETAAELVRLDLRNAREEAKAAEGGQCRARRNGTGTPCEGDRLTKARAHLAETAEAMAAAVTAYAGELSQHEWLHHHEPWDASVQFPLSDLPGVNGLVDVRTVQVAAPALIRTIKDL